MTKSVFFNKLSEIIANAKIALLATADKKGKPYIRWMTPAIIPDRQGTLFALTSKNFSKISQLRQNPDVYWQIQTRTLDEIISISGKANLIDLSSLKNEILEQIGSQLQVFWKNNEDPASLIAIETIISEATYFKPIEGFKESLVF